MRIFCACCGHELPELWDAGWPICDRCQPHCLRRHQEGMPYWRAVYAAQHKFEKDCPFQKGVATS